MPKYILKKNSQSIFPLIEQCEHYIRGKAETIFYSKEKKCYVEDTQKTIVLEIKIKLRD